MRTIVDIPKQQIEALRTLGEQEGLSRAELMRRAVAEYLVRHQGEAGTAAFGLWRNKPHNSVAYQEKMREEWDK